MNIPNINEIQSVAKRAISSGLDPRNWPLTKHSTKQIIDTVYRFLLILAGLFTAINVALDIFFPRPVSKSTPVGKKNGNSYVKKNRR